MFVTDELVQKVRARGDLLLEEASVLSSLAGCPLDTIQARAAERMIHICIECIADIGNYVIDQLVMRDPASYADIIDILCDEGVYSDELAGQLAQWVSLRKPLVQEYRLPSPTLQTLIIQSDVIVQFVHAVYQYLDIPVPSDAVG